MRLLDFIVNLSKSQPEIYGFSQLLSIVDSVRTLGYDIYSEFNSDKYSEEVITGLHLLNSTCENCSFHTNRTNVALPDGYIQSDIFMVTDFPEILDDRTGVIGSTVQELTSSGCNNCSGFSECYTFFDYKTEPSNVCNFIPLRDIQTTKRSDLDDIVTPFSLINKAFKSAGVSRKYNSQQRNEDLNIYITSVFKCLSAKNKSYEELLEESTCQKTWLENERLLSNAPYTVVLGVETAKMIFGKRRNFKGRTNKIISIDTEIDWKNVIILEHPKNVQPNQAKEYTEELVQFLKYLKDEKKEEKNL